MMLCPECQAPIDIGAAFCGHCGAELPSLPAGKPDSVSENTQARQRDHRHKDIMDDVLQPDIHHASPVSTAQYPLTPIPGHEAPMILADQSSAFVPSLTPLHPGYTPKTHKRPPSTTSRNLLSIAVVLALLGTGIAASAFAFWQNKSLVYKATPAKSVVVPGVQGTVTFHDSASGQTNSLDISVQGLNPLHASGAHYAAWIIDENEVHIHPLGTLVKTGTTYALTFVASDTNVLGLGNKIQVTLETTNAALPIGRIVLSAQIPASVMVHMDSLLVSYPTTPHQVALLPGLKSQAQLFYNEAQQLHATSNQSANRCIAQNMLAVLDGQRPTHAVISAQACSALHISPVSLDLGLLGSNNNGYVDIVGVRASLASSQPDATSTIRQSAQHVVIASANLQQWFTTLHQDLESLLQNPAQASTIQSITQLSANALKGVDTNNDGKVSPVSGEAGAMQAYLYGQAMATLTLATSSAK